jgi:hypothetical protein
MAEVRAWRGLVLRGVTKDLQLWRLRRREVEPGLGQEAVDEAGPVLHPLEPGLHQWIKGRDCHPPPRRRALYTPTDSPATLRNAPPGAPVDRPTCRLHTVCIASAHARVAVWLERAMARRGSVAFVQLRHAGAFLLTRTSVRTLPVPCQLEPHRGGSEGSP